RQFLGGFGYVHAESGLKRETLAGWRARRHAAGVLVAPSCSPCRQARSNRKACPNRPKPYPIRYGWFLKGGTRCPQRARAGRGHVEPSALGTSRPTLPPVTSG